MQTLENLIIEKYELNNEIERLKRKLKVKERSLEFLKKEIYDMINEKEEDFNIKSITKAMHDF